MRFLEPVREGLFVKRYKRFFADILEKDQLLTAHVPNTGSLKSCLNPNSPCRYTCNDDPKRKLKYTLQMIQTPSSWVGVNTSLSNDLVWEAYSGAKVKHWKTFNKAQREVKLNEDSRLDLVLWHSTKPEAAEKISAKNFKDQSFHFVEIKNVTLADGSRAQFPDAETTRGQKHLREMMHLMKQGHTAELVFTVQREDCVEFSPADDIDPEYGKLLRQAVKLGLKVSAWPCILNATEIQLDPSKALRVIL